MFPISSDSLLIREVADYWGAELAPGDAALRRRREVELKSTLMAAWWRLELDPKSARRRLAGLISLFTEYGDCIEFTSSPAKQRKTYKSARSGFRFFVPVPGVNTSVWTVDNCKEAFEVLAKNWHKLGGVADDDPRFSSEPTDGYRVVSLEIEETAISRAEFREWIRSKGFAAPTFWGDLQTEETQPEITGTIRPGTKASKATATESGIVKNKVGRKPTLRTSIVAVMEAELASGVWTLEKLRSEKQEALETRYGASRETVIKARKIVLSKQRSVGNSISDIKPTKNN